MCRGDDGERPVGIVAVGVPHGAIRREGVKFLQEHSSAQRLPVREHVEISQLRVG